MGPPDPVPVPDGRPTGFWGWLKSLKTRYKIVAAALSIAAGLATLDRVVLNKYVEELLRSYGREAWQHRDIEIAVSAWQLACGIALLAVLAAWAWFKLDSTRAAAKEALAIKDNELAGLRRDKDEEIAHVIRTKDAEISELVLQLKTDDLTQIPNRRQIKEKYEKHMMILQAPPPDRRPFSLAYLDIVNFKDVNEHLLHERADAILVEFANTVLKALRAEDDSLFRLAGDQFALLLSGATVSEVANFVAPRINRRLAETPFFADIHPTTKKSVEVTLQCRFGITDGVLDEKLEPCLKRADAALRLAKKERLVISDKEKSGIRIVTKAMVLDNPDLIAAEPMIKLPD